MPRRIVLGAAMSNEDFLIIPRVDLPSVKRSEHDKNSYYTDGQNVVYTSVENARVWVMRDIAVWQFLEAERAAHSTTRRDELAVELSPLHGACFVDLPPSTQHAIDRIIKLESEAKS
jgi:hypothetical protein